MTDIRTRRLTTGDRDLSRALFALMAEVFEEPGLRLGDGYLDRLLAREDFWAIAAFAGDAIIGGLTAHTLPMTRTESSEIFIYDIAVHTDHQRKGVGRQLLTALRDAAAAAGIDDLFVPADNDDVHALDFYRALGGVAAPVTIFTFSPPARPTRRRDIT
jgi:aminoglycoside 3-N-acetyltransferase I